MEKKCQNCIHSKMGEHIKSGKYRNFIYTCNLYSSIMVLDHWKRTDALTCKDYKPKENTN